MTTVEIVWTMLLLLIVLLLPLVISGLHRLWRASWNIEYYLREMVRATRGIQDSTANLKALDQTIAVAGGMLQSGPSIAASGTAIRQLLKQRASRS